MYFRVFYLINRGGECVSSINTVTMSAKDIHDQLLDRLHSPDDYLGLIDDADHVLQILRDPEQPQFYVELPVDTDKASYSRTMTRTELNAFILNLPDVFTPATLPDFVYQMW